MGQAASSTPVRGREVAYEVERNGGLTRSRSSLTSLTSTAANSIRDCVRRVRDFLSPRYIFI